MSEQGLTERDYKILTAGFLSEEIGEKNKYKYIKRSAIHRRLRLVDPNWMNHVETYIQVDGDTVTAWGSITLKGVTRYNCATKQVTAWASKENGGERFCDADVARELANAKMKATSALIFRCAEAFEVGLYLKEKRTPHTLASVLNEGKPESPIGTLPPSVSTLPVATPPNPDHRSMLQGGSQFIGDPPPEPPKHWALNGDGEKIRTRMNDLGLTWDDLKSSLEHGKTLAKLSDTILTYDVVYHKMDEIKAAKVAAELEAKRAALPASQKGDEPISVKCADLQINDLVQGLNGRGGIPSRLMHCLGDTPDGIFTEWIVWSQTRFTNVTRLPFDKSLSFKVTRRDDLVEPPDVVKEQVADLIDSHQKLSRRASEQTQL